MIIILKRLMNFILCFHKLFCIHIIKIIYIFLKFIKNNLSRQFIKDLEKLSAENISSVV